MRERCVSLTACLCVCVCVCMYSMWARCTCEFTHPRVEMDRVLAVFFAGEVSTFDKSFKVGFAC